MELKYKIEILSEWHIGSGLGAGAETDAEILKDEQGLPYIPGKTIKGLLKDAFYDITDVKSDIISYDDIVRIFGNYDNESNQSIAGHSYFANATLDPIESEEIVGNGLQKFLFKNIASTAIDKNGIADDKSLRTMEGCMPLKLQGTIIVEEADKEKIKIAAKWARHLGINRNRGLGRCKFIIE
jgi:CRISPR/Cas system CSM-associated protein Csm3 (group 7 of RAMP superfamily)